MTVRVSRYRELCSICRAPTDQDCFRCKAPLCDGHAPAPGKRCHGCELEYRSWPSREPRVVFAGGLLALLWVGLTLGLLEPLPPLAVIWALAFPIAVVAIAARRLDSARATFLRQEKRPRAAADPRQIRL